MTTIAAFFPMLLGLQGSQREYVYSLPVTITVVLGLSYVLAMTFCVLLAYRFIRAPKNPPTRRLSPVDRSCGRRSRSRTPPTRGQDVRGGAACTRSSRARVLKAKWIVVVVSFGAARRA